MVNQILLNNLNGTTSIISANTVGDLRTRASEITSAPPSSLRLVTQGHELINDQENLDGLVQELGNVYCLARLLGGGKKRKKKTYTKPKKLKHKKKKEKMAVLKFYKIGDDGKVQRLRRECPADTCGAGIFMAAHADRFYCGKCTLTYVQEGKE